ncbi:MAG: hypothetical protein QOK43_2858 [Acidimicrobiaceae bacterium]|nr:hypothetical protein [Acidimicrobiaceae bacterium]
MLRVVLIVSLLSLVLGGAGCDRRGGGDGRDRDTLPPPPKTTSTTAPSFDVPAVIDAAYVGRVMQALDHVYGDGVRHLAVSRSVDEEFLKHLLAIHNPRIFQLAQDLWVKIQARGFEGLAATPADPVTRVDKLLRADRDCILIEGDRNLSPLHAQDDPTNHDRYVALSPLRPDRNPVALNQTPWAINFSGQRTDGSVPEDACVAQ